MLNTAFIAFKTSNLLLNTQSTDLLLLHINFIQQDQNSQKHISMCACKNSNGVQVVIALVFGRRFETLSRKNS